MTNADVSPLVEDLLLRGEAGAVRAADVRAVARGSGFTDPALLRSLAFGLIAEVLVHGLMVAVDERQHLWKTSTSAALGRIAENWFMGEPELGGWLAITPRGAALANTARAWATFAGPSRPEDTRSVERLLDHDVEDSRTLIEDMVASGQDDWVDAAEVYSIALRSGLTDPRLLRTLSVGLIAEALTRGLMVPGDVHDRHQPWELSTADAIGRVAEDWFARSNPHLYFSEVVYLENTPQGAELGDAVLAREEAWRPPC